MRKYKNVLVTISSLALSAAPISMARAQIVLNCSTRLYLGEHDVCGNGTLDVDADGGTSVSGCLVKVAAPKIGQCVLRTGGVPVTKNVLVKFNSSSIFITSGGASAKVNNFMMIHTGTATSAAQFTFTPAEVSGTVTLDVGGRLNFNTGLTLGVYTGSVTVSAVLQ